VLVYQPSDEDPVTGLVNPRITARSDETETADEGCLSLGAAAVIVPVERPVGVTIEALTPAGESVTIEAEGLEARVLQHEIDHLDGVLTFDRATPEGRRAALAELRPQPVLQ
jgi:peptide deformylase